MPETLILGNDIDFIEAFVPVDLQDGTNTGDWLDARKYSQIGVLFGSGLGTGTQDPTITVLQAKSNTGGSSKALNIKTTKIFKKQAATSLAGVAAWSSASADVTTNTWTEGESAEQDVLVAMEWSLEDLDVTNKFTHIRASVNNVGGNAQPGFCLYYGRPMFPSSPGDVQSGLG